VYGVHEVQMHLPRPCVSAGTLALNYGATKMAPTQKDQPLLSLDRRPHFETHKRSWNEHKLDHGFRRVSKPRMTVLARTSSNLLDWTVDRQELHNSQSRQTVKYGYESRGTRNQE
jgi:hypothetical protein